MNRLGERHEYEAWGYQYLGGKLNDKKTQKNSCGVINQTNKLNKYQYFIKENIIICYAC